MKFLKLAQLFLLLVLSSCQSNLDKAGEEHALVFKKWQTLSKYAANSFLSNSAVNLVGELTIVTDEKGRRFVLTNLQLSSKETPFQINLLHPSLNSKFICQPQCLQLNEYLQENKTSATMLSRYFAQQEFDLFKFYGEVFLLDETIKSMQQLSKDNFQHYIDWLINENVHSTDLAAFINYLTTAISEQSYIAYLSNPNSAYTHLLPSGVTSNYGQTGDGSSQWLVGPTADEQLVAQLLTNNTAPPIVQNAVSFSLGDLVCDLNNNEFGSVTEIRGKQVVVKLVGKMWLQLDNINISASPGDIINKNITKSYTAIDGTKTFNDGQLVLCQLD